MARRVLIAGVSVRALAESATRAGYRVTALDAFGDLDLEATAERLITLPPAAGARFSAAAAARAVTDAGCDAVVYASGFENQPRAVARLAAVGTLWGNTPAVLARVRDPLRVSRALRRRGFLAPRVRVACAPRSADTKWLLKPRASGGGHGIAPWRAIGRGRRLPRTMYLQQWVEGVAGSIVFAADGRRAVPLGLSRILAGRRAFGSRGFRYSGNVLSSSGDPRFSEDARLLETATTLAAALTEEFGLVGLNGIDFVVRRGVPYPIEVNPRYTASMELVERAYGLSMFEIHVRACRGALPHFDLPAARAAATGAIGKAIVYARRDTKIPDSRRWLADSDVRDVPHPGERIARGRPVCTVFARARDGATSLDALEARAAALYRSLELPLRRIA
jgi:predicted ATP-grasp superfamily ATP-dependent carboligase